MSGMLDSVFGVSSSWISTVDVFRVFAAFPVIGR